MADNPFLGSIQNLQANRASLQLANQYSQPGMAMGQAAMTQAVSNEIGMSVGDIGKHSSRSASMAMRHGLDRSFGLRVGQSNAAFATAWDANRPNLGSGGLSDQSAGQLDRELRLAAAKSPMANTLGAMYALSESGVISKAQLKKITDNRELMTRGPGAIMAKLRLDGANMNAVNLAMGATKTNMEQIAKHNLQDSVRGLQRGEMIDRLSGDLANELAGGFGNTHMNDRQKRAAAFNAGQAISSKLMSLAKTDPGILSDQDKLLAKLQGVAPGVNKKELAGALAAVRSKVKTDPGLRKFGNLEGLLALNAGAVEGGDKLINAASKKAGGIQAAHAAAQAERNKRLGELKADLGLDIVGPMMPEKDKERADKAERRAQLQQLAEAGDIQRGPAAGGRGPGGDPQAGGAGSGGMRITGNITLLDGGQGQLEAQAEGAAPGG